MSEKPKPEYLRHAWGDWRALERETQRFLSLPAAQSALEDDQYRLGEFTQEWSGSQRPSFRTHEREGQRRFDSYYAVARALYTAANHTQKLLADGNASEGMFNMTRLMEQLNLLTEGSTLHTDYEKVDHVLFDPPQTIQGLSVRFALALKVLLSVTTGKLTQVPDRLVTESHAIHLVVTHRDHNRQSEIARVNHCATQQQLEDAYGYGKPPPDPDRLRDRLKGMRFRGMEIAEMADELRVKTAGELGWTPPQNSRCTTVTCELCTEGLLRHQRPIHFQNRWRIGPQAEDGNTIDFYRGDVAQQIRAALHHLVDAVLNYPPRKK